MGNENRCGDRYRSDMDLNMVFNADALGLDLRFGTEF